MPEFTLVDILKILQDEMGYAQMNINLKADEWTVTYTPYVAVGTRPKEKIFKSTELVDALYKLLTWIQNGNK